LNLLKLIDNSEQDIPLIGLLRSPLVGMSVDELARISLHGKGDSFWIRCQNFRLTSPKLLESITEKLNSFFNKLDGWKSQCPYLSVPELLELILSETHYLWWLQTQSRKEQRLANVQKFQQLASQFESEQKGTLYQFLQSIEDQEEIGVVEEPPAIASDNSVQLMTIHQSKGLEFPVVFLPFLGRKWNLSNMNDKLQIDPEMGLCLHIRPPGLSGAYPSFLQFVAKNNERLAQVGEELRKFYVALTRAKQKLYLSGSVSKAFEDRAADISWPPATDDILNATSTAEWVHAWVSNAQSSKLLSVPIPNWGDSNSRMQDSAVISKPVTDEDFRSLQSSHAWKYRGEELTEQPAKTSVTQLKNRASIEISEASPFQKRRKPFIRTGPDAIERGKAFHLVLETMSLNQGVSLKRLREHVEKLVNEKALTREEADSVHLENVVRFWQTMEGSFALLHHAQVRRELPFTYRLSLQDYNRLLGEETTSAQEAEFVVLQGIIDLTVITDSEIYIVDFKTDKIPNQQILSEKITNYGPQLSLYKRALEEIYKKPVIWTALHFLETGYTHVVSDPVPV
ncbi:MAG: addA, partial [Verrucomicrobiales bacterium]|nr:addA [Verrucomicrobiales bacterium]